jgi:hypothetical protein
MLVLNYLAYRLTFLCFKRPPEGPRHIMANVSRGAFRLTEAPPASDFGSSRCTIGHIIMCADESRVTVFDLHRLATR